MASQKRDRPNAKGRNGDRLGSGGAVLILRRSLWLSPQVSALSPLERTLLMEMTAVYSGPKPGRPDIILSVRDAGRRCGVSDHHAIKKAFDNLTALGLVTEAAPAHFAVKAGGKSKARAWRLNWKAPDGGQVAGEALPPLNFQALDAKQKRRVADRSKALADHAKGNFSVVDSTTMVDVRAMMARDSVVDSATLKPKNSSFALPPTVGDSTTHIYYQGGAGTGPFSLRKSILQIGGPIFGKSPAYHSGPELGGRFCDLVNLRRLALRPVYPDTHASHGGHHE